MTPSGIILSSSSQGATKEAIEKVLSDNGYEPDKPEPAATEEIVEPKRDDFQSDEEFEAAQDEYATKQQELADKEEQEEEERQRRQEEKHPKLTRRQRAIDKATRELQEKNRRLEERLAALEGGKKPAAEEKQLKIEVPQRDKFKSDAEFDDAMFDYRYKVRRAKEQAEAEQTAVQKHLENNFKTYQSAVAEFKDDHDDWDDVVNNESPINESTYLSVIELGADGPAVTYYLGTHPDYARKLSEMTPHSAAMEVGRLSLRLKTGAREPREAGNGRKPKPKPRLPEPVKPVSTAATSSTLTSSEAAKKRDYRAFKVAQRAGR